MRWLAIVLLAAVSAVSFVAPPVAGSDAGVRLMSANRGISVRLPRDWHLIRRGVGPQANRPTRLQPAVMASFVASFARHPCPCPHPENRGCGEPCSELSVRDFPAAGALVFVWEFPSHWRGYGHRPVRLRVAQTDPQFAESLGRELRDLHLQAGHACVEGPGSHPSWVSDFRDAGRVFQLEVYLGPAAGPAVRARADALLDSLDVAPRRSG